MPGRGGEGTDSDISGGHSVDWVVKEGVAQAGQARQMYFVPLSKPAAAGVWFVGISQSYPERMDQVNRWRTVVK